VLVLLPLVAYGLVHLYEAGGRYEAEKNSNPIHSYFPKSTKRFGFFRKIKSKFAKGLGKVLKVPVRFWDGSANDLLLHM